MTMNPLGIFGGTFNPIHEGHIAIAKHVLQSCKLERIEFIPCFQPPHRDKPIASPEQRLEMVKLAIATHPEFSVNEYEMQQKKISYTINTVKYLRETYPAQPLCLILGGDAFSHFHEWREHEKIIELVHLIVVSRSSRDDLSREIKKNMCLQKTNDVNDFHHQRAGLIYFDNITPISISATQIRNDIQAGKKNIQGLNHVVEAYILKNKVY